MQLNIKNLLEKRTHYPIADRDSYDIWLNEIVSNNDSDTVFYIGLQNIETNRQELILKQNLFEHRYLYGIFDLSSPYTSTAAKFSLFVFKNTKPDNIYISNYKANFKINDLNNNTIANKWRFIDNLPIQYSNYLSSIEKLINEQKNFADTNVYELNTIPYADLDTNNLYTNRYSKRAYQIKNFLQQEKIIKLEDFAEILRPKIDRNNMNKEVKVLRGNNFSYPLNYNKLPLGFKTDIPLKKGDIVFQATGNIKTYFVAEDLNEEIFTSPNSLIVRVNDSFSAEYLYMYLQSETAKTIMESLQKGINCPFIGLKDLKNFPIIIQTKPNKYYHELFIMQYYKHAKIEDIQKFINSNTIIEENNLEDIFDSEQMDKIKSLKNDSLKKILEEDLKEINSCYKVKAYKAALILCGSVLEAFVLDWLNELQPEENWLEKRFYTNEKGEQKIVGLDYYINKISKISTPPWMKSMKSNAHQIRTRRNLVHAKLCLKEDLLINEELCKNVILYLKEIIALR